MNWKVRPGLHHCGFGRDFVMLDLAGNRYFMLTGKVADEFAEFLSGSCSGPGLSRLDVLGLIAPAGQKNGTEQTERTLLKACHSILDEDLSRPPLSLRLEMPWEHARARWQLRRGQLQHMIAKLATQKAGLGSPDPEATYEGVSSALLHSTRYVSYAGQCLPRSVAVMRMLLRRNLPAEFVIGVTLPFQAHCWVQIGSQLLSDRVDLVRNYHPILVL